jgi:anti-sigma B factor antagonist
VPGEILPDHQGRLTSGGAGAERRHAIIGRFRGTVGDSAGGIRGRGGRMRITERVVGSVTVLDLSGKLALDDGNGLLKDKIHSLLNQGRMQIALNLAEVTYVDSAGLGELVASQGTVTKNGGQVKVFNLTKRVSDLLTITKVLTVFDTYNSEAEALAAFQPSAT